MSASIGRRYAKAIIAVAEEQDALEQTGDALRLLRALAEDPQIAHGLSNPLLSPAARRGLARAIADQFKFRPMMRNFLSLLADHRRLDALVSIADEYQTILDAKLGRVRATFTSAAPLTAEQVDALVSALARKTGRTVLAEQRVDPALLGGVVVDVGGKVYDGSLRTQLEELATTIAGGRALL
jgi:F-type H+-transporting ATPase subunit delta